MKKASKKVKSFRVEDKMERITNVAAVPQLSPFRYPGGKTWLVPEIRKWLDSLSYKPRVFVEPFAGGAIASLTAVIEDRVETAVMCELDSQVAAVWETILADAEWLAERILSFDISLESVRELLSEEFADRREVAFQTLVRNRTQRGGILAPGASLMNYGENGKGIASRWYPETLAKRIRRIAEKRDQIRFIHGDGISVIEDYADDKTAAFFIDPPYTAGGKRAGKRLYAHNEVQHEYLFDLMSRVSGSFLMTYDDTPEVTNMAQMRGFNISKVLMKNTHNEEMYELLIFPRKSRVGIMKENLLCARCCG
jgi:DNA adenine methylase